MSETAKELFRLRGKLPRATHTMIEIGGVLLLLLLWQLVASISTTRKAEYGADRLNVYLNTQKATTLQNARIILYDRPVFTPADLQPIITDFNNNGEPVLLITSEPNRRSVQSLADSVANVNLVVAMPQGNKAEMLQNLSEFTGSAIINDAFYAESETPEIVPNLVGEVNTVTITQDKISFAVKQDWISNSLLPSPLAVLASFKELFAKDNLLANTAFSVYLNLTGYLIAILISLPLGFFIGLFPLFRALFNRSIDALRFVPLTAVTGLFIAWFGIGTAMKVQFLAFGIFVYLLPVIVQRIDDVDNVYQQTAYTLGATKWQQIRTVFIPAVISKVADDIRVLVAISWTYIIVAELVNANSGGIGALAFKSARMSRIDKVFAILLIIILIGFIQDKLFTLLDRLLFPYKHQTK
ncbi:MAG TPA: ABC transporter permease [Chitinophagales bacterium]|nr:ABC transporter permease [Chitinophagales bacterium]HRK28897.1 ABC transporter permease [Chitinophagales bacterium]